MAALLYEESKVTLGKDLVADGTSDIDSAVIDMQNFDEVEFLVKLGDVDAAAVVTFTVKENTASSVSSPTPTNVAQALGSTNVASGVITSGNLVITESSGNMDDKIIRIAVKRSALTKRYVFLRISMTVESLECDFIGVIQRCSRSGPVSQSSDVIATTYAVG